MQDLPSARALWIIARQTCELRAETLAAPRPDEVVVETMFGAISRGTERLVFEGRVPGSEAERMRGPHQAGAFPFPVKYGYACIGRVVDGPDGLQGRTVFALHPHQDRFVVAAGDIVPVPDGIGPDRAVLAANMETALNVVWDAGVQPGDAVTVIGAGLVGLLVARLSARIPGTHVQLVDTNAGRGAIAEALGCAFSSPGAAAGERDVVIHASGTAEGLRTAIGLAGTEARIVEASWYGEGEIPVALGGAFHARRLAIVASQVGSVPPHRRARWSHRRRLEAALGLLADARLDALFSGETAFSELPARYGEILAAPDTLCHRIRYV